MMLLHDRYAADGDCACDLVTGEAMRLVEITQGADPDDDGTLAAMVELLDHGQDGSPRWVVADAKNAAQAAALQRRAAAAARRRGYVAIAVAQFPRWRRVLADDLRERALVLIAGPGDTVRQARNALLTAASDSPRPHVLLTFRSPQRTDMSIAPGGRRVAAAMVREARAVYGGPALQAVAPVSVLADEAQRQLQRAERAHEFVRTGRHAAAERLLRDVAGALERRRAYSAAGALILRLASLLVERGRVTDAGAACHDVVRLADRAGDESLSRQARAWEAWVRIERGQLTDAEGLLRALMATAGGGTMTPRGSAALLRCLVLQQRLDEAVAIRGDVASGEEVSPVDTATLRDARVMALVGAGRIFDAGQLARAAVDQIVRGDDPLAAAVAHTAHLRVLCACGDLALAATALHGVIDLARQAHAPFRAVWARLIWLDAARQGGLAAEVRREELRLIRIAPVCPPLLKAAVTKLTTSGPPSPVRTAQTKAPLPLAPALVRLANEEEDDRAAIRRLLERLAAELSTSRIEVLSADGGPATAILAVGAGAATAIGPRVLESGVAIGLDGEESGREAGVPVRLGAQPFGALACRWPLDRARPARSGEALELAAAILAPRVETLQLRAREAAHASVAVPELLGASDAIEEVRRAIARAARAPFSVLIEGESGTGKELVARAIHQLGARRERRFCDVNCAALPDDLLESELFGHTRGAFTGAVADRPGLFEEANGGTLFMDEVAELSARAQAKLLRVVQQQEVRRVGETFSRPIDVRLIAAANRDLHAEAQAGRFRQDLLYRLDVIRIRIPPLRDRPGDVVLLARHFWRIAAARIGTGATLAPSVIAGLGRYAWPGNVREVQNVMSALAVAAPSRGRVPASLLPHVISTAAAVSSPRLADARIQFERRFIEAALAHAGGNRARAARALGVSRQGLLKLMTRVGL